MIHNFSVDNMYDDKILSNCLTKMFHEMENKIDKVKYMCICSS